VVRLSHVEIDSRCRGERETNTGDQPRQTTRVLAPSTLALVSTASPLCCSAPSAQTIHYTRLLYCSPHLPNPDGRNPIESRLGCPGASAASQPTSRRRPSILHHAQSDLLPGWHGWAETLIAEAGGYEQRSRSQQQRQQHSQEVRLCACKSCNMRVCVCDVATAVPSKTLSAQASQPAYQTFRIGLSYEASESLQADTLSATEVRIRSVLLGSRHPSEPRSKTPFAHIHTDRVTCRLLTS
jgi:hypothetical protein